MKDETLLVSLLKEMAEDAFGQITVVKAYGDKDSIRRHHHACLLADTGLAKWVSEFTIRITAKGYSVLEPKREEAQKTKIKGFLNDP